MKIRKVFIFIILILGIISFSNVSNAKADTTPPEVNEKSLKISNKNVSTNHKIHFEIEIKDESGVSSSTLWYRRPNSIAFRIIQLKYNEETGLFEADININENWESGLYRIYEIDVVDNNDNYIRYHNNSIATDNIGNYLDFSNGNFTVYESEDEIDYNNPNYETIKYTASDKEVVYDEDNIKEYTIDFKLYMPLDSTIKYANSKGEYVLDNIPKYSEPGTYVIKYQITRNNCVTVEGENVLKIDNPIKEISISDSNITMEIGKTYKLNAFIKPINTTDNKKITWSSYNSDIAEVDSEGNVTAKSAGTTIIYVNTSNNIVAECKVVVNPEKILSVNYMTHVQDYGWQDYVKDGEMSGTSGKAKRLEGINIKLSSQKYSGNIEYKTHVQDYGWQNYVKNGEMSGTSGQSKRLEAIQIRLTGEIANYYDVYYRVHCENIGWMNWAKNDEKAGTEGYGYRLEGIEVVVLKKGESIPKRNDINYSKSYKSVLVTYQTHVQDYGWQNCVKDGEMSGTSGQSKRLEGIRIRLNNPEYSGNIEYRTHVQDYGWQDYVKNGEMSGTSGQSKRLEAIQIRLTGEIANYYDVYYRVHCENIGWMNWAKNNEKSGTEGLCYRLEGIEIVILKKGENVPERKDINTIKTFIK